MDCDQADKLMVDYLYRELPPSLGKAFEEHLKTCPEHAREAANLRAVLALVRGQKREEVPGELSERILRLAGAALPEKRRLPPWHRMLWNPVSAAAVLIAVVSTVGIAVYHHSETIPPQTAFPRASQPAEAPLTEAHRIGESTAEKPEEWAPAQAPPAENEHPRPAKGKRRFASTRSPAPERRENQFYREENQHRQAAAAEAAANSWRRERMDGDLRFAAPPPAAPPEPTATALPSPLAEKKAASSPAIVVATSEVKRDEAKSPAALHADSEDLTGRKPTLEDLEQAYHDDLFQEAEQALAEKHYARALAAYRAFLERFPGHQQAPTCRYRIAKALFLSGRCAEAIPAIREAVKVAPHHTLAPEAMLDQGSCHVRLNQLAKALDVYRRIEREYPNRQEEAQREILRLQRIEQGKPAAAEPADN